MKNKMLGLMAVALMLSGCSTMQDGSGGGPSPERIRSVVQLAAFVSAEGFSIYQPESVPAIKLARDAACSLKSSGKVDLAALTQILTQSGLGNLNSQEGALILIGGQLFFDTFFGQQFQLDSDERVKAAIAGVCDGLSLAFPTMPPSGAVRASRDKIAIYKQLVAEAKAALGR